MRACRNVTALSPALAIVLGLAALLAGRTSWSEPMAMKILARSAEPVTLDAGPVVVSLPAGGESLAARADALTPGRRLYLVVRGLTAAEAPGVLYAVFLDLPAGARPAANDLHQIGVIDFFSARPPGAPNAPDAASAVNADAGKLFFSFDLTPTVLALRQRGLLSERTTLTFLPEGAPVPTSRPRIGSLELVEQ